MVARHRRPGQALSLPGEVSPRRVLQSVTILLAIVVALVVGADAAGLLRGASRPGLLMTSGGRIVALDPDGAAAAEGLQIGDLVVAAGTSALAGPVHPLLPLSPGGLIPVQVRSGGKALFFWLTPLPPSATEMAGTVAALTVAVVLWLSALWLVLPRARDLAARLAALAHLTLALAIAALVARAGGALWAWPLLAPATLWGSALLLWAQWAQVGPLRWRPVVTVGVVALLPALVAVAATRTALPLALTLLVPVAGGALALALLIHPLLVHGATRRERVRRAMRLTLLGVLAAVLPPLLGPGLTVVAAQVGHPFALVPASLHLSPLWSTFGLAVLALLDSVLFIAPPVRHLEEWVRGTVAVVGAVAVAATVVVAVPGTLPWYRHIGVIALAAALIVPLQRLLDDILARPGAPRPDYQQARRVLERLLVTAPTVAALAQAVGRDLAAPLRARSALLSVDKGTQVATGSASWPPTAAAAPEEAARPLALIADGQHYGLLLLGPRLDGDDDDSDDRAALDNLARLLALEVAVRRVTERLEERTSAITALSRRLSQAHERERAHLSRELHDVVAQELIALTRQLRRHGNGVAPSPDIWADMLAAAQEALVAIRRICNGLRPAILDLGLAAALRDLVAEADAVASGPQVSLIVIGHERRLNADLEFALFRVAQEGLQNALSHGHAHQIRVELLFEEALTLHIRDDGRGFMVPKDFEDLPGDHLGLLGMRERIAEFGGSLQVSSSPGRGTTLMALVTPSEG